MLVGEQPVEPESPAARLLARALADAGLDQAALYRTSAVKHAKRRRCQGRSLPVAPEPDEIAACRRWLDLERALVRPQLIVALGTVAAGALLERPVALGLERGRIMPLEDGSRLLVTAPPAAIVAIPDPTAQGREYRRLVSDLLLAVPYLRRAA
jgi:DNA polymerase